MVSILPKCVASISTQRTVVFGIRDRQGIFSAVCPAGIIDEDIDASKGGFCEVESPIPIFSFCHVHLDQLRRMMVGS